MGSCKFSPGLLGAMLLVVACGDLRANVWKPKSVLELPKHVKAPAGKLTLYADYSKIVDPPPLRPDPKAPPRSYVTLYIVNRTGKKIVFPAQDGDLFIKLEMLRATGSGSGPSRMSIRGAGTVTCPSCWPTIHSSREGASIPKPAPSARSATVFTLQWAGHPASGGYPTRAADPYRPKSLPPPVTIPCRFATYPRRSEVVSLIRSRPVHCSAGCSCPRLAN